MSRPVQRGSRVVEVEPLERVREVVRVALAPDLAVGDDVDAGLLHVPHREHGRVVLRLIEPRLVDAPQLARGHARRQPPRELLAIDQPVGLWVAADDRGRERIHRDKIRRGGERRRSRKHTRAISPQARGAARPLAEPLAVARQVAARDPALRCSLLPLGGVRRDDRRRVLRDPLHGSLSARDLRLQRRRAALDVAGGLLLLRRARHRPLSALHPGRGGRLPGEARGRLPRPPVARARPRQVVAARHSAVHRGRHPRRRRQRLPLVVGRGLLGHGG